MYIPNEDKQNYFLCRLKSVIQFWTLIVCTNQSHKTAIIHFAEEWAHLYCQINRKYPLN